MAKPSLLSLSLCLLVLFNGCLASRLQEQQQNQCQIDRLDALEPTNRVEYEAGLAESWDPNHEQFQCAGVAVVRHTIQPNGLLLPFFTNAPQLVYIVRGEGITSTIIPGCPETYQAPQEGSQFQGQSARFQQDQHQKIRRFRAGDIIALPVGVSQWCYNDGNEPVVAITLLDVQNKANQLDTIPRIFQLAGNQREDEFQQQHSYGSRGQKQSSCNNVFCGFDTEILAEAFNVDRQLIRKLQNENDNRGAIIKVKGSELRIISPPRMQRGREFEEREEVEREREREERRRRMEGRDNGIEETYCSMRFRENIGDPSRADLYTPQVGRISTLNSFNLPVLRHLQLSACRGMLHSNAIMLPHWNINAHSIMYVLRGNAQVQVVDNNGNSVFDGEVREGQILMVPQNFAVVKRARSDRFEWIAFKTNDNAVTSQMAGQTSVIRAMPEEVIANAFQVSREDARRLKYNNEQTMFTSGGSSQRRIEAVASA